MRITVFAFAFLLFFMSSCGRMDKDHDKAVEFYNFVSDQIILGKPEQQKFIDKLTASVLAVKENENAIINSDELQSYLVLANAANLERQKKLEEIPEFDEKLNYKAVVMDYFKSYNSMYENDIPEAIKILGSLKNDRFEKVTVILFPKLESIKEKEIAMKRTQDAFKNKYQSPEPKATRVGSNFEYVELKNFKFRDTTLKNGSKIKLLFYSGGSDLSDGNIYYVQFIGIEDESGDTIRILAPTSLQKYDLQKARRSGTYVSVLPAKSLTDEEQNAYIIFNRDETTLQKKDYYTVFGVLKFEE